MPLPLVLWGAAAALGATGIFKGVTASDNFSKAKSVGYAAEKRHKKYLSDLEAAKAETQHSLEALGALKVKTFTNQIKYLVEVIKKRKEAKSQLEGFNEDFTIEKIQEYERLIFDSLEIEKGLATGAASGALAAMGAYGAVGALATASTGAAIGGLSGVAATNATLAWLGGGALSAGGFGMAGGMIALGGIVLGPALAIGGFMLAGKSEQALTKAAEYDANVDEAVKKIENLIVILKAIKTNAEEVYGVIIKLASKFDAIKVADDSSQEDFMRMLLVGKALKQALDIAIIKEDGTAVDGIKAKLSGLININ